MNKIYLHLIFILLLLTAPLFGVWSEEPDIDTILDEIDELSNFDDTDFTAVYTIVSEKPGEEQSVTKARLFRRDHKDQYVLIILKPEVQKGQGYLMVDENVWFYDPESRKFEKSTLRENIQDSDAQNTDLNQSSLSEDYQVTGYSEDTLGSIPVWVLELEAKREDVSYDTMKLWVRKDRTVVLKEEDYSVNGRLMRTVYYPKYTIVGEKILPRQVLIVDEINKGEKTQYTMSEASTEPIPDSVFSKNYLERVNR
ncbi:MAG: outer membrane lipoprotein-sorting protein [Spirochaetia bacterium]